MTCTLSLFWVLENLEQTPALDLRIFLQYPRFINSDDSVKKVRLVFETHLVPQTLFTPLKEVARVNAVNVLPQGDGKNGFCNATLLHWTGCEPTALYLKLLTLHLVEQASAVAAHPSVLATGLRQALLLRLPTKQLSVGSARKLLHDVIQRAESGCGEDKRSPFDNSRYLRDAVAIAALLQNMVLHFVTMVPVLVAAL